MRIALAVEYNGKPFCGWQRQKHSDSVQQNLEQALAAVADHPVTVHCAGRTDTGVHALAQVVHFDSDADRPQRAWTFGVNTHLPPSVAVHWSANMPDSFHARYSATARSYRYTILNRINRPALNSDFVNWVSKPLQHQAMHQAAQALVGTHDFTAFRSADCQAPHAVRTIRSIDVTRAADSIFIDITGNAFLHNMVRIITGSLIKVGLQERPVDWLKVLLAGQDRTMSGMTASAAGLCFLQPTYPDEYAIPCFSKSPSRV